MEYAFFKGKNTGKKFDFDSSTTLSDCRKTLIQKGFMTAAESDDWRFVNFQNQEPDFSDMVVGIGTEKWPPISSVCQKNTQRIYLTNVHKKKEVDLLGFKTEWFWDRFMGTKVTLNEEKAAESANKGKFQPLMLTNVKPANQGIRGAAAMNNVIICEKDSLIKFWFTSWGGAGYSSYIKPQAGTPITSGSAQLRSKCGGYSQGYQQCYYSEDKNLNDKMIKVVPTDTMDIGGKTLQYMKFTCTTRNITEYSRKDGTNLKCALAVPTSSQKTPSTAMATFSTADSEAPLGALANAKHETVVPGVDITPGSTVPAKDRSAPPAPYSPITDITVDNSQAGIIGEVTFYLFVFKSHEDAKAVFDGVNDIDASIWS